MGAARTWRMVEGRTLCRVISSRIDQQISEGYNSRLMLTYGSQFSYSKLSQSGHDALAKSIVVRQQAWVAGGQVVGKHEAQEESEEGRCNDKL